MAPPAKPNPTARSGSNNQIAGAETNADGYAFRNGMHEHGEKNEKASFGCAFAKLTDMNVAAFKKFFNQFNYSRT